MKAKIKRKNNIFEQFKKYKNDIKNPAYFDRSSKNKFVANELKKDCNISSILNLGGGGKRHLEYHINSKKIKVTEIDISGECDYRINLDKCRKLPFRNSSFDAVCALDVLEHLDEFHLIINEMYRVSKRIMLISLPNSTYEIKKIFFQKESALKNCFDQGFFSKYYGLPLSKPVDRHKWWLPFHDIINYFIYFAVSRHCKIEFWTRHLNLKEKVLKKCIGEYFFYLFFCKNIWIKLKKS